MKIEPIGRRIAGYRKSAGFKTAQELADAIGNPAITKSTIQNVESGRKADLSVSQLLDIAKVLDIPPVALIVPIDKPMEKAAIPGVGPVVSLMSNWEVVNWFRGADPTQHDTYLGQWLENVMSNINRLVEAIHAFPAAKAAVDLNEPTFEYETQTPEGDTYTATHDPHQYSEEALWRVASQAQDAYKALKSLTRTMDLRWAEGPWLEYDTSGRYETYVDPAEIRWISG